MGRAETPTSAQPGSPAEPEPQLPRSRVTGQAETPTSAQLGPWAEARPQLPRSWGLGLADTRPRVVKVPPPHFRGRSFLPETTAASTRLGPARPEDTPTSARSALPGRGEPEF